MTDIVKDIFSNDGEPIDKDTLLKYLNGELPADEMHRVESMLLESDLMNDAVEGLQEVVPKNKLPQIEMDLESRLKKQLQKRKAIKARRTIKELPWVYIFIIIIILLILISFAVVKSYL